MGRANGVRVDWRASLSTVGTIQKWSAVLLVLPLFVAVVDGEDVAPFLATAAVAVSLGVSLERLDPEPDLGGREAFLMVSLTWLSLALVGAIPFVLAGNGTLANPVNALFESMSGVTTTGATVVLDFDAHSRAAMLWRSQLQWLGGLSILVLAVAVLSTLSYGGAQLMETETQTKDLHKLTPRIAETARLLGKLYLGLTLAAIAFLYGLRVVGLAPEMTLFDAVAHAFTSVSTSGYSPRADSIAAFSPAVQWATIPLMAVGATNFVLLYNVTQGRWRRLVDNEEFRFYLGILGFFTVVVAGLLVADPNQEALTAEEIVRHSLFQVTSIVTTTGYASADFDAWSPAAKNVLFLCMFIGGMAGSTTCSIKALRWLVALKAFRRMLFTTVHPQAIRPLRLSGEVVDEDSIHQIYAYTLLSVVIFFLATIFVVADGARAGLGLTEFEAMSAAAATFLNIGPAFGVAGPFASFTDFPASTKLVMTLLMWIGRIEIIPVLVLFTRAYWWS
ncbi:TrkH family potassium uptake protein [Halegenticoccus tardaugens]|uniref:TrkH family potassium uptake protein n=1 Tax=Halegenticoccus tardaugens TaxID=2071624 RepID=UPI00100B2290